MEEVRPPQPKQFLLPFVAAVVDAKDVGSMLELLQKSFPFEEEVSLSLIGVMETLILRLMNFCCCS